VIEFPDIGGSTEPGGETHLKIAFEIPDHREQDEKLVDALKDSPAG